MARRLCLRGLTARPHLGLVPSDHAYAMSCSVTTRVVHAWTRSAVSCGASARQSLADAPSVPDGSHACAADALRANATLCQRSLLIHHVRIFQVLHTHASLHSRLRVVRACASSACAGRSVRLRRALTGRRRRERLLTACMCVHPHAQRARLQSFRLVRPILWIESARRRTTCCACMQLRGHGPCIRRNGPAGCNGTVLGGLCP